MIIRKELQIPNIQQKGYHKVSPIIQYKVTVQINLKLEVILKALNLQPLFSIPFRETNNFCMGF